MKMNIPHDVKRKNSEAYKTVQTCPEVFTNWINEWINLSRQNWKVNCAP